MLHRARFQRILMSPEGEPGTSGSGTADDDLESLDQGSRETNRNSNDPPSGSDSPFRHPSLQGKSEEEIAQIMERAGVLEATVREQGQALNRIHRENQNRPVNQGPPKEEEVEEDPQRFWEKPHEEIRSLVRKELSQIITPFREDLAKNQTNAAWQEVGQQFSDLETYRPLVEHLLSQNGNHTPTADDIRTVYYTAKGYALANGGIDKVLGRPAAPNNLPPNDANNGRQPPPQHRASNQPLRNEGPDKKDRRQLTETERKWARLQGFTKDEEYLDYLEQSETEVIEEV